MLILPLSLVHLGNVEIIRDNAKRRERHRPGLLVVAVVMDGGFSMTVDATGNEICDSAFVHEVEAFYGTKVVVGSVELGSKIFSESKVFYHV